MTRHQRAIGGYQVKAGVRAEPNDRIGGLAGLPSNRDYPQVRTHGDIVQTWSNQISGGLADTLSAGRVDVIGFDMLAIRNRCCGFNASPVSRSATPNAST